MSKGKIKISENRNLIALIGDEDTITGFLLTGIGERNHKGETNFFTVDDSTPASEIEAAFERFVSRPDVAIVMITQKVAESIRNHIFNYTEVVPTVLEIPSKDSPYDPSKDSLMERAARQLFGADKASSALK